MTETVLIVDDDERLRSLLREYLEGYGYSVELLADGIGVADKLPVFRPDIVILDVMMPKKNGFDVLADIRKVSATPVIMLTAKGEDADRIVGLEMGADDYMPKPFNPRELLARIKAVLRRSAATGENPNSSEDEPLRIEAGGLILDKGRQTVTVDGNAVELSTTEYRILEALMKRPNRVLTRDRLMNLAHGREFVAFDRSVDVHISKLRAKVEVDPRTPERIKTIWGTGYMFVAPEE